MKNMSIFKFQLDIQNLRFLSNFKSFKILSSFKIYHHCISTPTCCFLFDYINLFSFFL